MCRLQKSPTLVAERTMSASDTATLAFSSSGVRLYAQSTLATFSSISSPEVGCKGR